MKKYEIIVIGGGPAAITLAKMLGGKYHMAIIRPEDHSMIYCAMPYAIEGIIKTEQTLKKDSLVTDSGANLIRSNVTKIDFEKKKVILLDSSELFYEKLIIATGAIPFIPPVPGCNLNGVMGFKTEKDLIKIQKSVTSGIKKAVVVGAGAIGIELAQALKSSGLDVDLVDMANFILPNLVDNEMTEDLEAELIRKQINLHLKAKVIAIEGKKSVVCVKLDSGRTIHFGSEDECSEAGDSTHNGLVIFAAGVKPEVDLLKESSIKTGRDGIVVNDKLETNIPNVYAVGDCTQFTSGITGEASPGKLATNAVPMAKVLGFNMLGQNRRYPGFYNGAATKVGNLFAGGTGLTEKAALAAGFKIVTGYSELTTKFPIMPEAKKVKFKLIADKKSKRLLGAQIVSGEPVTGNIDLLTFAIQKKTPAEELVNLSYSAQPYQSYFPAANGVVLAAEEIVKKLNS